MKLGRAHVAVRMRVSGASWEAVAAETDLGSPAMAFATVQVALATWMRELTEAARDDEAQLRYLNALIDRIIERPQLLESPEDPGRADAEDLALAAGACAMFERACDEGRDLARQLQPAGA